MNQTPICICDGYKGIHHPAMCKGRGTILPIHPRNKPLSERLRASEAEVAYLHYKMEAMESSLQRLWAAFSVLEEEWMVEHEV